MKKNRRKYMVGLILAMAVILGSEAAFAEELASQEAEAAVMQTEAECQPSEEELAIQQAAEEASRQAEEEAARKAAEEASRLAAEEASRVAAEEASRVAAEEASRVAAEEASRVAAEEASRQAAEEASRQAAEEASRQAAEDASSQAAEPVTEAKKEKTKEKTAEPEAAAKDKKQAAQKLDFLPYDLKVNVPESMTAGSLYTVTLELKNITDQVMEKLALTLSSKDDRYVITAYKDEKEAQDAIARGELTLQKMPEESKTEKDDIHPEERLLKIRTVNSGETIKTNLVLLVREDIQMGDQGLKAKAVSEFQAGTGTFSSDEEWELTLEKPEEEPSQEEPSQEEPSREEPSQEEPSEPSTDETPSQEEPSQEEPSEPSTDEIPSQEEPTEPSTDEIPSQEEPTDDELEIQEAGDEDEIVVVDVIGDGEEETTGDDLYYDDYYSGDWGTYSGVEETQINTATPYVLVKSYGHKKTINTGDTFALEITFLNTSQKIPMENVMIKVETSDSLSLANGTNTLFVNGIGAGETTTQRISLLAAGECKDPTQKVNLTISFEYIANKERKQGEAAESITIPITQKDRLEVQEPVCDIMEAGREGVISIPYVNKGFSSLYNMEATLSIEGAEAAQSSLYAGNVESGNSGSLDFVVTPLGEGDYEGTVTLTYEDSAQKEVSIDVPVRFTSSMPYVEEPEDFYEDDFSEDMPAENEFPLPWVLGGAGAVVLAVIIILIAVHKKKKARKAAELDADDWFNSDKEA